MDVFVINLAHRTDRWRDCSIQSALLNANMVRVDAISSTDLENQNDLFTAPDVAATWKSHQKAMQKFLECKQDYALILEDDFVVKKEVSQKIYDLFEKGNFDFLQLGYLTPHFLDSILIMFWNLQDMILKFSALMNLDSLFKKYLISEQRDVPFSLVLNDIRAGGHAYIVSRKFAEACQLMNNPTFLSTDGMFMALGISRNFKTARLRKSRFGQSNSLSSVGKRFKKETL